MKKFIAFALALALCTVGVFAEGPSITGDVSAIYKLEGKDLNSSGNLGRVRLFAAVPVGDFVKVNFDFRDDANVVTSPKGPVMWLNQVYAVTDVSGALGIDAVKLTLTGGLYECWMSNWNAATSWHRPRYVETWAVGKAEPGLALDIGIGDIGTILTYIGDDASYKFGFKLGSVVDGLNAIASYSGGVGISYFKADAGYTLSMGDDMSLTIPASFLANLEGKVNQWGSGLKFVGMGLTAAVDVGSSDLENKPLEIIDGQVRYDLDILQLRGGVYSKMWSENVFQAVDLGVRVTLGANKLYAGYVINLCSDAESPTTAIAVTDDDNTDRAGVTGGGIYIAWRVTF